ncbi:MAG: hypothetical protein Tsb0013_23330 [Phycisphaerales bacterium]
MNTRTISACFALIMFAGAPALADDFAPPEFRGGPRSVYAEWDFSTPFTSVDIFPEVFTAVDGPGGTLNMGFQTKAELSATGDWLWVQDPLDPMDGGITPSSMDEGASLAFKIQNYIDLEPEKLIRIQFTYQGLPPIIAGMTGFFPDGQSDGVRIGGTIFPNEQQYFDNWIITPNPWWELIEVIVPANTVLDQVVIDTISIPSPSAFALLGVAGVVALRRRR